MPPKQSFLSKLFRRDRTTSNKKDALASFTQAPTSMFQRPTPRESFLDRTRISTPQRINQAPIYEPKPVSQNEKIMDAIGISETGGLGVTPGGVLISPDDMIKDRSVRYSLASDEQKYTYRRPAPLEGSPNNEALGKYQVTSDEMATYAPRYLGRSIMPDEFINSPEQQEAYMIGKINYFLNTKHTPGQIADIHRKGIKYSSPPGSDIYQNPEYVRKFHQNFYGSLQDYLK